MPQDSHQAPEDVKNAVKPGDTPGGTAKTQPTEGVAAEPSGPKAENPATAGPGKTEVKSGTPENALGRLNPSAPEDANVTPGSATVK